MVGLSRGARLQAACAHNVSMRPFQDTHPGGPDTLPFDADASAASASSGPSMRLLGVLLGVVFALLHGYALINHGALGGMSLLGQASKAWLLPWHGLWFLTAALGWLGLVGIVLQSWEGVPEDQARGLRWLVMAGLLSCLLAPMPWLMAPAGTAPETLGSLRSLVWLVIPLPFWLGWSLRVHQLEQLKQG